MKLNIKDRLVILNLLPNQGSILELTEAINIANQIKLSDEEKEAIDYKVNGNNVYWDINKNIEIDIDLNQDQITLLKNKVKELDSKKVITIDILNTCLKINNL